MSHHNPPIGQILDPAATHHRDAVHFALAPVIAATDLAPGTHAKLISGGRAIAGADPIGIVDPFLKQTVLKGQRFYLLLYPNTVTGMRHCFSHPSFPDEPAPQS